MNAFSAVNSVGYDAPAAITVNAVVLTLHEDALGVLLLARDEAPYSGCWSLPGGFLGAGEAPEQTVIRKVSEETGMPPLYFEQLQFYGAPERDPRGWIPSICYLALVPSELLPATDRTAAWMPVADVSELAFDHATMLADAVERLRGKLWYSNVALGLLPRRFTLSQARAVYEAISAVRYEPNNFRRRLQNTGLVRATHQWSAAGGRGRPAELYEFCDRTASWGRAPAVGA